MSRFKVGDRVRVKDWESVRDFYSLPKIGNSEFMVVDINDDTLSVIPVCSTETNCYFVFDADDTFELAPPTDPKREFLERLQSLMREFDASIDFWYDYIDQTSGTMLRIGNSVTERGIENLTADTIMDFDKE